MIAKRIIMVLASFPLCVVATTWYASPTGADNAACTEDDPGTISRAIALSSSGTSWEDGDTIELLPANPYYSLHKRSPACDAGQALAWTATDTDLAGNRRLNGRVDIGCYEFWPLHAPTTVVFR